ncbi:MAG: c-type cytochrome [Gammaproteobacteria bacterium]|nr:c-type cytochrome [Gammaproteobacteria bacterium]
MSNQDQSFFDRFMVIIGSLIAVTVFLIFLSRMLAGDTQLAWVKQDPTNAAAIDERIKPVGYVSLPGDELAGGGIAAAIPEATPPVAARLTGEQVYNAACFACHGTGVGGAPKLGDAAAWKPRVAKGKGTLNKHALEGFQGETGYMPPKGGRVDLSDEEIIAAVGYVSGT